MTPITEIRAALANGLVSLRDVIDELCDRVEAAEAERDDMRTARNIAEARAKDAEAKLADANRLRSEAISTFKAREDAIERAEKRAATAEMERDSRADDAKLGAAVRAVLDMFMWDHSTVRAEVESDRLAETVEGCIFVAIERAIRPADFVPAHAKASGGAVVTRCIHGNPVADCLACFGAFMQEQDPRDAELASLRNEVSRLSALSTAHIQIADVWKARAARDAETIERISRLVGPPRCEACVREGRYVPCLECPEPGAPSGWVSGGGTSEVK